MDSDQVIQSITGFAKECRNCEVFVYRIKKARKNFFGKKKFETEGSFYDRSELKLQETFKRKAESELNLKQESAFYQVNSQTSSPEGREIKKWFFYYGHHLPELPAKGYSRSFPEAEVSVPGFSKAMKRFGAIERDQTFDVSVFSTCQGGTPFVASYLSSVSDFLIASPEKLHLSHLLPDGLSELLMQEEINFDHLLEQFTMALFEQHKHLNSMVSVSLYPLGMLRDDAEQVQEIYGQRLNQYKPVGVTPFAYQDCERAFPELLSQLGNIPVITYFKPPRFGRLGHLVNHSGWSCPRPL